MDKIQRQAEHFNSISERYASARKNANHLLLKSLIWSKFFADKEDVIPTGGSVLEPMCGMAEGYQITSKYIQSSITYHGFDYSENMVSLAKNKFPHLNIAYGDATTFLAGERTFDFIVLIGGLHHVFQCSQDVINRLAGSLKVNGYFLNFEPTHNSLVTRNIRKIIYKENSLFDEQTEQGFELSELDQMFLNSGFTKVDQVYPGLLAYILFYNPDAFPWLNIGGRWLVRALFWIDSALWRTWVAKKISFSTISLWKKTNNIN